MRIHLEFTTFISYPHSRPPFILNRPLNDTESDDEDEDEDDEEHVGMDSSHNLDSHYSDTTPSHSTTSTAATALHLNPNSNINNGGECGGGGILGPPRNMANRRTSLADIISRVRRTSAGLQSSHPLQPLTESKSELPHYSIPCEKFADKRVKVSSLLVGVSPSLRRMKTRTTINLWIGARTGNDDYTTTRMVCVIREGRQQQPLTIKML